MSTHALIGYVQDNAVRYTYCHYDGYIEWLGLHLHTGFARHDLAVELIEGGEIRSISPKEDGTGYSVENYGDADPPSERPLQDFTLSETGFEWLYLWDGGDWWCMSDQLPMMMKLEDAIKWREEAQ